MADDALRKDAQGPMIEMMTTKDAQGPMIEMMTASPSPWPLRRLGIVMEPDPGDLREGEGVRNPAVGRGLDGELYLLPRLVAPANCSGSGVPGVVSCGRVTSAGGR